MCRTLPHTRNFSRGRSGRAGRHQRLAIEHRQNHSGRKHAGRLGDQATRNRSDPMDQEPWATCGPLEYLLGPIRVRGFRFRGRFGPQSSPWWRTRPHTATEGAGPEPARSTTAQGTQRQLPSAMLLPAGACPMSTLLERAASHLQRPVGSQHRLLVCHAQPPPGPRHCQTAKPTAVNSARDQNISTLCSPIAFAMRR